MSFCKILKKNIVRRKRSSFIYCVGPTGFLSLIQMLEWKMKSLTCGIRVKGLNRPETL